MRIATSPINWNNEDVPETRRHVPYPAILDEILDAGYTATEWSSSLPTDPDDLLPDLVGHDLEITGAFVGLELRNPSQRGGDLFRALQRAAFLHSIGGSFLVAADSGDHNRRTAAGRVTVDHGLSDAQWLSLTSGLNDLGRRLRAMGMQLVFHNHVGTYVESAEETARLLDSTDADAVGWCLDCGHLAYGGGDTLEMLRAYGDRVAYAHLKDVDGAVLDRARAGRWDFHEALKRFVFTPLGEGIARIPQVVEALMSSNKNIWVVVEQDTTSQDPTETARRNREYLEELT